MIRFSISAMEKAPVHRSGVLEAGFLDLAPDDMFTAVSEVQYDLVGKIISGGVLISGSARVQLRTSCGRCTGEFEFPLILPDMQLFFEVTAGEEELDVSEDLRAELLLELPMNPLCRENCRGLCPECGCDRNVQKCSCQNRDAAEKVSPWSALDGLKLD